VTRPCDDPSILHPRCVRSRALATERASAPVGGAGGVSGVLSTMGDTPAVPGAAVAVGGDGAPTFSSSSLPGASAPAFLVGAAATSVAPLLVADGLASAIPAPSQAAGDDDGAASAMDVDNTVAMTHTIIRGRPVPLGAAVPADGKSSGSGPLSNSSAGDALPVKRARDDTNKTVSSKTARTSASKAKARPNGDVINDHVTSPVIMAANVDKTSIEAASQAASGGHGVDAPRTSKKSSGGPATVSTAPAAARSYAAMAASGTPGTKYTAGASVAGQVASVTLPTNIAPLVRRPYAITAYFGPATKRPTPPEGTSAASAAAAAMRAAASEAVVATGAGEKDVLTVRDDAITIHFSKEEDAIKALEAATKAATPESLQYVAGAGLPKRTEAIRAPWAAVRRPTKAARAILIRIDPSVAEPRVLEAALRQLPGATGARVAMHYVQGLTGGRKVLSGNASATVFGIDAVDLPRAVRVAGTTFVVKALGLPKPSAATTPRLPAIDKAGPAIMTAGSESMPMLTEAPAPAPPVAPFPADMTGSVAAPVAVGDATTGTPTPTPGYDLAEAGTPAMALAQKFSTTAATPLLSSGAAVAPTTAGLVIPVVAPKRPDSRAVARAAGTAIPAPPSHVGGAGLQQQSHIVGANRSDAHGDNTGPSAAATPAAPAPAGADV
jgi:hypothetical protein